MPRKVSSRFVNVFPNPAFLRKRELGFKKKLGFDDKLCAKLTTSLDKHHVVTNEQLGGIFNLEFSPNGSILAAACEKKSIHLYDALTQRLIRNIDNAHSSCVNLIRFIDRNTFASGSDDSTVKLWDIRFLREETRTLQGHSNWVKNIECCPKTKQLVTSAFDGRIYTWDLNNYTENGVINNRVFTMDGLSRMKLTPDGSKMVICATSGYILVIHDLNLETLSSDLRRFKPSLYRLMQTTDQNIPIATSCTHLFSSSRKRNRVELISDFPNDPEVISSLQIHPMGWCALTRNINSDELSEWTCVHDIQDAKEVQYIYKPALSPVRPSSTDQNHTTGDNLLSRVPLDLWIGLASNENMRQQRMRRSIDQRSGNIRTQRTSVQVLNSGILATPGNNENTEYTTDRENEEGRKCKVVQNLPRLTHYVEEPNLGKGFIKELCFSPDGRIMCSPYNKGIRLFSFNTACNELSTCVSDQPQQLNLVSYYKDYHSEIVVSCKFNPNHSLLVSGCLGGQITWYQPKF